jgi:hypothetical protein
VRPDPAAYERGAADARREAAQGRLRWFSGAPSEGWGRDLADTLRARFGIDVTFTTCFVTDESVSYEEGFNAAIEAHADATWGKGALSTAIAEVRQRRKRAYDAWVAANMPHTRPMQRAGGDGIL